MSQKMTTLFAILNSCNVKLSCTCEELVELLDIYKWFTEWKQDNLARTKQRLLSSGVEKLSDRRLYVNFFTKEAADDFESMILGIVQMVQYYTATISCAPLPQYFVPRKITQDKLENTFGAIRVRAGANKLTHETVARISHELSVFSEYNKLARCDQKKRNCMDSSEVVDTTIDATACVADAKKISENFKKSLGTPKFAKEDKGSLCRVLRFETPK